MKRFLLEENGQDLVEYALIVAAVALALLSTVNAMANEVAEVYRRMAQQLETL